MPETAWFDFENHYNHYDVQKWTYENRYLSVIFGLVYVALVHVGRSIMRDREAFVIRRALTAWNFLMFTLSAVICVRLFKYNVLRAVMVPLREQICIPDFEEKPLIFWLDLFVLSKPIEFIDTLFIILRKQPLHFLHWYHHATVVILCWYSLGSNPIPGNSTYYASINSFIHTIMYFYYFLRSMKIILPKPLQMTITSLQIVQMIIGCFVNLMALSYRLRDVPCGVTYESIFVALGIYACYLVLFIDYFRKSYFGGHHHHHHHHHHHDDASSKETGSQQLSKPANGAVQRHTRSKKE